MMKIGIGNAPYIKRLGFEKAHEFIRMQGYECVDYQCFINTGTPLFEKTGREFDAEVARHRAVIEANGLEISQTHAPWRWPAQDAAPEDRAERFEKMAVSIRGTALLGCKNFVIHPLLPWLDFAGEPEKLRELNLEFMSRLCRVAEENGVVICFENMPMPRVSMASPEACLNFAREINSPNFKICLDTGHCTMLGVTPGDAVRMLGKEMLQVLHVHDNNGQYDLHWVPCTGTIDWDDFRSALQEIGFDGCLSLETAPPPKFTGEMLQLQERSLYLSACKLAGRA